MTLGVSGFRYKKDLKAHVGQSMNGRIVETSMFGTEFHPPGRFTVVGPDAYTKRDWFATIHVDADGVLTKVE